MDPNYAVTNLLCLMLTHSDYGGLQDDNLRKFIQRFIVWTTRQTSFEHVQNVLIELQACYSEYEVCWAGIETYLQNNDRTYLQYTLHVFGRIELDDFAALTSEINATPAMFDAWTARFAAIYAN